jgi:hypothetical protein
MVADVVKEFLNLYRAHKSIAVFTKLRMKSTNIETMISMYILYINLTTHNKLITL